jgi:hypothetical protein
MFRRSLRHIRIRPLRPSERNIVASVFVGLSPASRERRYLRQVEVLTPTMLAGSRPSSASSRSVSMTFSPSCRTSEPPEQASDPLGCGAAAPQAGATPAGFDFRSRIAVLPVHHKPATWVVAAADVGRTCGCRRPRRPGC